MSYSNILVPINIYENYHHILNSAEQIAHKYNASLTLLMVLDTPFELVPMANDYQKALEDEAIKALKVATESLQIKSADTAIAAGTPHNEIIAHAKKNNNDLIVLGSHGKHGVKLILGSTSNAVLHHATCDVLTVHLEEKQAASAVKYKNIVISTDMSPDNDSLIETGKSIAEKFNATLNAINVQSDPAVVVSTYGIAPDMHTEIFEQAKKQLQGWATSHGITGEAKCAMGNSSQEVINYANELDDSLIVVGSHHKSAIGRFFLGSTANAILHYAKQDVLVVKLKN
ncbi:universal stress protein [Francisellaceae bacterium]|nr:universal stress protein [Francisellaceae bacterium]